MGGCASKKSSSTVTPLPESLPPPQPPQPNPYEQKYHEKVKEMEAVQRDMQMIKSQLSEAMQPKPQPVEIPPVQPVQSSQPKSAMGLPPMQLPPIRDPRSISPSSGTGHGTGPGPEDQTQQLMVMVESNANLRKDLQKAHATAETLQAERDALQARLDALTAELPPIELQMQIEGKCEQMGARQNQDAMFMERIDERNAVVAVLDGHGSEFGAVAAKSACEALRSYLLQHWGSMRSAPQRTMEEAFAHAHEVIERSLLSQEGVFKDEDGVIVSKCDPEDWDLGYDSCDGGTTATVVAVVDGQQLVVAMVGDSVVLSSSAEGGNVQLLLQEHTPTSDSEWKRMQGKGLAFLYETEDVDEADIPQLVHIWKSNNAVETAQSRGCGFKTVRDDLCSRVMTRDDLKFSQMYLGVTRSLGDFWMQRFGLSATPEVRTLQLTPQQLQHGLLLLAATDGFWDNVTYEEAMISLAGKPPPATVDMKQQLPLVLEEVKTAANGLFGEDGTDNLTAVAMYIAGTAK